MAISEFDKRYAGLFVHGAPVRFTGTFLKNTGQQAGGEGQKVWSIVPCTCGCEDRTVDDAYAMIAVNEKTATDLTSWRHIARANLMIVGGPLRARDYP